MTREEIDQVLAAFDAGEDPARGRYVTGLQALAEIVRDQEHRLRVLEPCPFRGEAHLWVRPHDRPEESLTCAFCGLTKEPPR